MRYRLPQPRSGRGRFTAEDLLFRTPGLSDRKKIVHGNQVSTPFACRRACERADGLLRHIVAAIARDSDRFGH